MIAYSPDHHDLCTRFYQKVVLSVGRCPGKLAAMLILLPSFGAPAFAKAEDGGVWRLAKSPEGVEDAIHHDGRFHSISYSGLVEVWDHDTESGAYTSTAIAPRMTSFDTEGGNSRPERNYLAVASGGRLMVVSKHVQPTKNERYRLHVRGTCSFTVHVLCDDGRWKETRDIGDSAVFVGLNKPYIDKEEVESDDHADVCSVRVYSLKAALRSDTVLSDVFLAKKK
jgi:hypothetical protein